MQSLSSTVPDPDEARRARRRVAAEQRKRIANACLACKSRKQKCDGQKPCNICSRRGADCIYVEQPPRHLKRRRESTQTSDGPSECASVRSTRSPCSPVQNKQIDVSPNSNNSSNHNVGNGDGTSTLRVGTYYAHPTNSAEDLTTHLVTSRAETSEGTGTGTGTDTDDDKVEAPIDHKTRLLSDPSGRLLYIGETGSLSFLARVRKTVMDSLGHSTFTSDLAQNSIVDRPIIPRLPFTVAGSLPPPPQVATVLIDMFFTNVNCVHYVLDREEMNHLISVVYTGGPVPATGARSRDIAFLNAVCAVGTFFTTQPEEMTGDGMQYFDAARTGMEDVFESADFWSVRLLLVFSLYMQYASKRNSSWTYIGLAIRVAESLGLHRIYSTELPFEQHRCDESYYRRRRLVFWTLYSLDRFTGCSLGRPLAIQDEDCNDPVFSTEPTDDPLTDCRCSAEQPATTHQIHQLAAKVRLHVIIGHIVKLVYLKRMISRDVTEKLSAELKTWWKSLPSCASLDNDTDAAVVQLHMAYLHAVILLTRPFLQRVVEASTEEIMDDENCRCNKRRSSSKSSVKRKMLRYAWACVLVAERTVALAHRMQRRGSLQRNDAALIYYLFTAGLVLTFSVLPQVLCPRDSHENEEDALAKFRNRAPRLIALMGECASVETCTAKRYHSILLHFNQALIEGYERRHQQQQAQRTNARGLSDVGEGPGEPDLLDELRSTSNEYFAGTYQSRAVSTEPASRESVAAHALVSVASNGQHDPNNQILPTYIDSKGPMAGLSMTPGVTGQFDLGSGPLVKADTDMYAGGVDFFNPFGWMDPGDGAGYADTQTVPWEFSWDGPPSNFFMSAQTEMEMNPPPG